MISVGRGNRKNQSASPFLKEYMLDLKTNMGGIVTCSATDSFVMCLYSFLTASLPCL